MEGVGRDYVEVFLPHGRFCIRDYETTSMMGPCDYDGTTRWMEGEGSLASLLQVVRVGAARKGFSKNQSEEDGWLSEPEPDGNTEPARPGPDT